MTIQSVIQHVNTSQTHTTLSLSLSLFLLHNFFNIPLFWQRGGQRREKEVTLLWKHGVHAPIQRVRIVMYTTMSRVPEAVAWSRVIKTYTD